MKKNMLVMLLLALCGMGCFTWPHDFRSAGTQAPLPASLPPGPVTADQVEQANAHRLAEAVWDEMDRDQQNELLPASSKKKK